MNMDNPQPVWPDQHAGEPPLSVEALSLLVAERGDPTKAQEKLGWRHRTTFEELVHEMVQHDLSVIEREHRNDHE